MRLMDFEPRWVRDTGDLRHGMGISFWCPACEKHKIVVFFSNPIDEKPAALNQNLWKREGYDFDTLSLSPSINQTRINRDGESFYHWHGYIKNGRLISVDADLKRPEVSGLKRGLSEKPEFATQ
jgi:hypothetical protein